MPIHYTRRLTSRLRTPQADRHLGCALAAIAGAINAVGFGILGHYTSHMTGMVSTFGERVVARDMLAALAAALAIAAFVCGAACCTVMIHHARRRRLHSQFALPLLLESALILAVSLAGAATMGVAVWATICSLTFAMGLQNALITKISRGEIRTTHVTGIVTDLGIECGRGLARIGGFESSGRAKGVASGSRARLLTALLAAFVAGCIAGTFAVQHAGRLALLPAGLALAIVALVPAFDDLRRQHAVSGGLDEGCPEPKDTRAG
jgi:uncharacterized membrane protein YoaK (UPF0700 family)